MSIARGGSSLALIGCPMKAPSGRSWSEERAQYLPPGFEIGQSSSRAGVVALLGLVVVVLLGGMLATEALGRDEERQLFDDVAEEDSGQQQRSDADGEQLLSSAGQRGRSGTGEIRCARCRDAGDAERYRPSLRRAAHRVGGSAHRDRSPYLLG
jgi:hypothetical protein